MMDDQLSSMRVLFQKSHIEALISNQKQVLKWESYKKDICDVQDRLKLFLRDLKVPVLVPIGNKALFRGKLVHTNDILISLGDSYFCKGSVDEALEIITRRLAKCDDMLLKLSQEKQLLESKMNLPNDTGIFSSDNTKEIIEEFNEVEEDKWKEQHRMKVKDYKQKLAKMKEEIPPTIKSDEDLWKRLDLLEMEEELNDAIDRLEDDETSCSDDEDSESNSESEGESDEINNHTLEQPNLSLTPRASILKHSDLNRTIKDSLNNKDGDNVIKIEFKHSSVQPVVRDSGNTINSPYDIYKMHSDVKKTSKKTLRRVSFVEAPEVKTFKSQPDIMVMAPQQKKEVPVAFGDVIERTRPVENKITESRPISKFKSSRQRHMT